MSERSERTINTSLPALADDLDAENLTALLAEKHPGVRVAGVELIDRHEVTNAHAKLRVTYDEPAGAPETMFCKLPPTDPDRRKTINATGMGRREALFYDKLAPQLALRTPAVHAAHHSDADGSFLLLLEDLDVTGCGVSDGTVGVAPDAAAVAIEELADMHVRFQDPARRAAEAPWVQPTGPGGDYGRVMLRYALDNHRDRLGDAFAELAELYIDNQVGLYEVWMTGPTTVLHGDAHLGNVFDDHGRTGFLDWGMVRIGPAIRDISYFITMGLSIEDRRVHERDLLRHYLDVRNALGGVAIGWDEAWLAHRVHASYNVPASCQIVMFPDGISERRRIFADAFLGRAQASVEDLESRAALREVGL